MKAKKRAIAWVLALALVVQSFPVMAEENLVPSDESDKPIVSAEQTEREKDQDDKEEQSEIDQILLSVSGTVFSDENVDGKRDKDEEKVTAIRIKLYSVADYVQGNSAVLMETVTDENGKYQFQNLISGKYRLEIYAPEQKKSEIEFEGVVPENMEEKILSGEWDYKVELPRENDEWIACVPEFEITNNRNLDIGLLKNSFETDSEGHSENGDNEDISIENNSNRFDTEQDSDKIVVNEEETKNNETESDLKKPVSKDKNVGEGEALENLEPNSMEKFDEDVNDEENMAVAGTESNNALLTAVQGILGQKWSYDIYYVHESGDHNIKLTQDGNLKYQIEFKANDDISKESVEIRVPRTLLTRRDGSLIQPSEIAVPEGTMENPVESKVSPFNYYVDGEELVFFNYKNIKSGTNVAFQVLYRGIDVMQIKDGTEWKLESNCTVTIGNEVKTKKAEPLTGKVDTTVKLNSISMKPHVQEGKNYAPGLYTKNQIATIIGQIPEEYVTNFEKYRYVVWDISVYGEATQPWELYVKNTALAGEDEQGKIVGFSIPAVKGSGEYEGYYNIRLSPQNPKSFRDSFKVVMAYPVDKATAGEKVTNRIEAVLQPVDKIDEPIKKEAKSSWIYTDYEWTYEGNKVGISKKGGGTYPSWLNAYKAASKEGKDKGGFTFNISSFVRGYEQTHVTSGDHLGQLIEDSSYKAITVDDFVYAYQNANGISQDNYRQLTYEDYYFDSVTITQTDQGYDPWEDEYATPERPECDDNGLEVYAMFAEAENPNEWTKVAAVDWEDDGSMTYSFTPEDLARKPWRVKVGHRTTNYSTSCSMNLGMVIRHDSKYFSELVNDVNYENKGNKKILTVENLAGVYAELFKNDTVQGYMNLTGQEGYDEPELKDKTQEMYKTLPMRQNAFLYFSSLQEHAGAGKSGTSWNDIVNGRVHLQYNMTAFDGYDVYGEEAISYLKSEGVQSPGRNEVLFYDLLPYGVKFDPSIKVTAGRITDFDKNQNYQYYPESWDQSQISVTVDSKKDIITNYKNSGRTMIIFHVTYTGADAAVYSNQRWMEGFGVSFGAYYDWKDTSVSDHAANIVAFMAEDNNRPFLGTADEVAKDDGNYPESLENKDEYKILGADIDRDGSTEDSVLYAQTRVMDDSAQASVSGIQKLVRADENRFGIYEKTAEVHPGKGYTYDITISNVSGTKTDVVVFDHLDKGAEDLAGKGEVFDENRWSGTFNGVVTTGLTKAGIDPIIYYNADPNAKTASETENPSSILTEENGWYTSERWKDQGKEYADVKSVAVDLSNGITGEPFKLEGTKAVTFQIKMISPNEKGEGKAYNVAQFYAEDDAKASYSISSAAEVSLDLEKQFELVKEFSGEIPNIMKETAFLFTIYKKDGNGERSKFSNQEYQLFEKADGDTWKRVGEDQVYATDSSGQVKLKAGQKILFTTPYATALSAYEEESPFWEQTVNMRKQEENVTVQTVTNKYRPVLYVQKQLKSVPEGIDVSEDEFTFRFVSNGKPIAEKEFWYVDSARTDGGIPSKNTKLGKNGVGKTDKNGEFKIRSGEIIALFSDETNCQYEVTETEGYGEGTDWICETPSVSGKIPYYGASAKIENIYRWKDLYITKELTNQDPADCTQEFTFCITDEDGKPIRGKNWVLMEKNVDTRITGTTDEQGMLTAACAGKTIRVENLEGGKSYVIEEMDDKGFEDGDYYEPVNRKEEVTMPLYGNLFKITFTNDYILRDLKISKVVNYDPDSLSVDELEEIKKKEFTMTVEIGEKLLKNTACSIMENGVVIEDGETDQNGQIKIKNGQTVLFEKIAPIGITYKVTETQDKDYPQLFPADQKPAKGTIMRDGASVQFINGTGNTFIIGKEYVVSDQNDRIEKEYINKIKKNLRTSSSVELELQIADATGEFHVWPKQDTEVLVIDTLTSTTKNEVWKANSSFKTEPWKNICISGMGESTAYRLSEREEDQHKVIRYEGDDKKEHTLEIRQKLPENDGAVEGTTQEQPKVAIVNEIKNLDIKNDVIKRVLAGDSTVPEGAQLAYRVEIYDGQAWNPAEKVEYIVTDEAGIISDRTEMTGADGMIFMYKSANGTPTVEFIGQSVKVHPKNPNIGTLRVVEVAESTDASWGRFAGYVDDNGRIGVNSFDGIGFANSNTTHEFEVEKFMEVATEDTFTMILEQITSATASPVTDKSQILEKVPGKGIRYEVYDSESGEYLLENLTGNKGEIYLKAGQYAKLMLEDGTEWTVTEKIPNGYTLKEMTIAGSNKPVTAEKLDKNMTVITTEKPRENLPGITLTKEMVENGIVNADTGEKVQLKEGSVIIPEKIVVDGKRYYVTAIGEEAFQGSVEYDNDGYPIFDSKLIEVVIPDTVTEIKDSAFAYCVNIKKLVLPDSIRKVGNQALVYVGAAYRDVKIDPSNEDCSVNPLKDGAETFKVPKGITEIGDMAFAMSNAGEAVISECTALGMGAFSGCFYLEKCVLSSNLKEIPYAVFSQCVHPSFDVTIPEGVERIGGSAFSFSSFDVKLPDSVKIIGDHAFSIYIGDKYDKVLRLPDKLEEIGESAFEGNTISDIQWNDKLKIVKEFALSNNRFVTLTLPSGVEFGHGAIYYNSYLEKVTFPKGTKKIPEFMLYVCPKLKTVDIPNGVVEIEEHAFSECTSLENISLPETLQIIGPNAFNKCESLKEIIIPGAVKYMGGKGQNSFNQPNLTIFRGCNKLEKIVIKGEKRTINAKDFQESGEKIKWGAPDGTKVIWENSQI